MEIQNYVNDKKELYENLLIFIDDAYKQYKFTKIIELLNEQNIVNEKEELRIFLSLINEIVQNHQRDSEFFKKIELILDNIKESIKQTYSNVEIFNIFRNNKRILLFLFESKIITIDEYIVNEILQLSNESWNDENEEEKCKDVNYLITNKSYKYYFYPNIKNYFFKSQQKKIEDELEMILGENWNEEIKKERETGENGSYICQLIRQDSVEEFISYVNKRNVSLLIEIPPSIFESNSFFDNKKPTLIEYAAFFGSIQIIRYLLFNGVEIKPTLWIYAIHSKNAEIIHLLEENHVKPPNGKFEICLEESIKCHHNEIARYIYDNLIEDEQKINQNVLSYSFHYYNYFFFPIKMDNEFIFHYLCQYNYVTLVKLFLTYTKIDINRAIII